DRCPRRARRRRGSLIEAGDNPYGGLVKMVYEILDSAMLAYVSLRSDTRGRRTVPITRSYNLVEGPFIEVLHAFFNGAIFNHQKAPGLAIAPIGRGDPSLKDLADEFVRHRVRLQPAHGPCSMDNVEDVSAAVGHIRLLLEQVMCADGIS